MPVEMIISQSPVVSGQLSVADEATLADSAFYWRERGGVKVLVCRPLEDAGFTNGFSTRLGGVSPFPVGDLNLAGFNEDLSENIYENRRRFLAAIDGDYKLATVWQIHSDSIKTLISNDDIGESDEKADALVSDLPDVLAGIKTADCVPVLIGDPKTGAFAAIHAGWRGTVESIVSKSVAEMVRVYGSNPSNLVAAIGPAACGRNYEIGQDVIDEFGKNFAEAEKYFTPTSEGHALVDLPLANRDQLTAIGVEDKNIHIAPFCTMERSDIFFSYRVEKRKNGKTGRLLSVIGRR